MTFTSFNEDKTFIENKYHDTTKPFNAFDRFSYHGVWEYGEGLDDEKIDEGLKELSQNLSHLPRPLIKAELIAFVLENTPISVSEHDWFVGIYSTNRAVSKYTVKPWHDEVIRAFPNETTTLGSLNRAGASYGWLDFDHTIPDWDALLSLGFRGILERLNDTYATIKSEGVLTKAQEDFYLATKREYEAVLDFIYRLYSVAKTEKHAKAKRQAKCLLALYEGAPTDTYEALQLMYLYFYISECVDNYQVRSLGYGLDGSLYPFYKRDLESGRYDKDEIGELLAYFMIQWSAIGNYWGQPFYLGGRDGKGNSKVNELTYLILAVHHELGLNNPKIQIKYNEQTDEGFYRYALSLIREGSTSIVFCSDEQIKRQLLLRGATEDEATDGAISGCYEYLIKNNPKIGLSGVYPNALKPVLWTLNNGVDETTGESLGLRTGDAESFTCYQQFFDAYKKQLIHLLSTVTTAMARLESRIDEVNPPLLFSATMKACVDELTDEMSRTGANDAGIVFSGLGTAIDALMAVKHLVFDTKAVDMATLKNALALNWEGYESLRLNAKNAPKYGCGNADADLCAATIAKAVSELLSSLRNGKGGGYLFEIHSARAFVIHGEKTGASPDGRKRGEETSKNLSPTPGADRAGVTALIRSGATVMSNNYQTNGACLDIMLHPSAVAGEDGIDAFLGLLKTFMALGGDSVQFNIFDYETLIDAQKNPDKYSSLAVRVCGWNTLWNNMSKAEQNAYIERAKNI